jgi:orotate phosphoribosyltransferase
MCGVFYLNKYKIKIMTNILKEFEDAGAILKGHFILSSGLHSDTYMQCARALMNPARAERICKALAEKIKQTIDANKIDLVIAPAMGGVIVGFETAKHLGKDSVFCERVEGRFQLRRGFEIKKGQKVLVIEDVVTTGKSSRETFDLIKELGGEVIAEGAIINRSGEENPVAPTPLITLEKLNIKTFSSDNVPNELTGIPAIKPGSRFLVK